MSGMRMSSRIHCSLMTEMRNHEAHLAPACQHMPRNVQVLTLEFWRAVPDWYQFMGAGAAAVAGANADALIIAGGSDSESLLAYVATQPLLPLGAPGHECEPITLTGFMCVPHAVLDNHLRARWDYAGALAFVRMGELAAQHVAGVQPLQGPHLCCQTYSRRLCGSHAVCLAASCGQLMKACATATDPMWLRSLTN